MSVKTDTVWRPTHGSGGKVVVRSVTATLVVVEPWPRRAARTVTRKRLTLSADKAGIVGYTATGETG